MSKATKQFFIHAMLFVYWQWSQFVGEANQACPMVANDPSVSDSDATVIDSKMHSSGSNPELGSSNGWVQIKHI